jgi:hypothetical protein
MQSHGMSKAKLFAVIIEIVEYKKKKKKIALIFKTFNVKINCGLLLC